MLFAIIVCVTSSIGERANEETLLAQKLGREQKIDGSATSFPGPFPYRPWE